MCANMDNLNLGEEQKALSTEQSRHESLQMTFISTETARTEALGLQSGFKDLLFLGTSVLK